ncbi:MAG TPA: hypothetical protein VFC78_00720 [Tepidisphaeraceae bacterium]|nr:hypothetical protein [Tepidisphaeraceae bacterium]
MANTPESNPASPEPPGEGLTPATGFLPAQTDRARLLEERQRRPVDEDEPPMGLSSESLRMGYEPEIPRLLRGLTIFLILFIVGMAGIFAIAWAVMNNMVFQDRPVDHPRSAVAISQQPPAPNLQPSLGHDDLDYQDLDKMHRNEDRMFQKLGWQVDPLTHEVQIPPQIAQQVALEALARAKAPPAPATTTGKNTNSIVPKGIPPYDTQPGVKRGGQQ